MSNAYLTRMPAGIPGEVTRHEMATIEPGMFDPNFPSLAFGIFTKVVSGYVRPIAAADTLASYTNVNGGFLVRPFPMQEQIASTAASELIGAGIPNNTLSASILKRGYIMVYITTGGGTAYASIAKGDAVYCRKTAGPGKAVGDLEAGSIAGNEAIPGAYFMGPADANGYTEIQYYI